MTIEAVIAELKAEIDRVTPIRNGWDDLGRAIVPDRDGISAVYQCKRAVEMFDERLRLLHLSWATLDDLLSHGHPNPIALVMRPDAARVIESHGPLIMAAIATVHGDKEAAKATVIFGDSIIRRK